MYAEFCDEYSPSAEYRNREDNVNRLLIKALLQMETCTAICKKGMWSNGYPDCKINWCHENEEFELDVDKLKKEFYL